MEELKGLEEKIDKEKKFKSRFDSYNKYVKGEF